MARKLTTSDHHIIAKIMLIIFTLCMIIAFVISLRHPQSQKVKEQIIQENEQMDAQQASEQKIYKNTKYGFSIPLPAGYTMQCLDTCPNGPETSKSIVLYPPKPAGNGQIAVVVQEQLADPKKPAESMKQYIDRITDIYRPLSAQQLDLNGKEMYQILEGKDGIAQAVHTYIYKDTNVIILTFEPTADTKETYKKDVVNLPNMVDYNQAFSTINLQ